MDLFTQIKVLLFSFSYGVLFYYLVKIQKNLLFNSKTIIKIILSSLLIFNSIMIYYFLLVFLNNGIFHIYFIFSIILGFISGNKLLTKKC